ncbi:MAG: cryptochrome/photolyase family protein [Mucilaginibacter polytrichastri]|nr:cryptochrome/photolyase family protein [Mucilaginibacter polytrichastri]
MPNKILRLVLGDQLNLQHSWYRKKDSEISYVLMEVMQEQEYVMHHVQKILGFFAAMRNFAAQLRKKGHHVIYIALDEKENKQAVDANVLSLLKSGDFDRFEYQLPDEYRMDELLKALARKSGVKTAHTDTEHFLTTRDEVGDFFAGKKQFLMENFYRHMRQKHDVLMQRNDPQGKRWNFDEENRKKYDGKVPLPDAKAFDHDVSALKKMIDTKGVKYFGEVDEKHFSWPLSRREALSSLRYFCENLLPHFGTYEDALVKEHASLFHSRLSFALNTKMISPAEVIGAAVDAWQSHRKTISMAQIEGFVRQILGWREFMRGVYWAHMPGFAKENFFGHQRTLPKWFWDGKTKMNCLGNAIGNSLKNGWAHHIQRLMVIGNFALLAGCDPDEVDEWYLGVYIDAIQWVEITNTRGMSQFADGGIVATKPYVSSAAYIHKMSDYCENCFYDYRKKTGEKACPYNSLYWNFLDANAKKLENNPRIGMVYKTWAKMKNRHELLEQAGKYLAEIDDL